MRKFKNRLREKMPLHITPKRIADALGVGTPTVSRWLGNTSQPRYKDHDMKLCELYQMTYEELFYEEEEEES